MLAATVVTLAGGALAAVAQAACDGVRPGAVVLMHDQGTTSLCTFNFAFRGSDGRRYIGTAGHCAPDGSGGELAGEHTWPRQSGPAANSSQATAEDLFLGTADPGKTIGHYAYSNFQGNRDFALIRLAKGVVPNPAVCHFGGPTGILTGTTSGGMRLHFYGRGVLLGAVAPARNLYAFDMSDPDVVYASGFATPGDSGSGVIADDGQAVGVLVTAGVGVPDGLDAGITRLPAQLPIAENALGIRLRLMKAPLAG
jgi:hypothetical protein